MHSASLHEKYAWKAKEPEELQQPHDDDAHVAAADVVDWAGGRWAGGHRGHSNRPQAGNSDWALFDVVRLGLET